MVLWSCNRGPYILFELPVAIHVHLKAVNFLLQDYKTAYRDWQLASRLCDNRELFYTLNYLISLSFDFGHFGKMLNFSVQQFQIAKYLNDANLMAESYLNMASSRGLLGNWELCLSYCKNCLLYLDATKVGYVYVSESLHTRPCFPRISTDMFFSY